MCNIISKYCDLNSWSEISPMWFINTNHAGSIWTTGYWLEDISNEKARSPQVFFAKKYESTRVSHYQTSAENTLVITTGRVIQYT